MSSGISASSVKAPNMSEILTYLLPPHTRRSNAAKRQDVLTLLHDPAWRQRSDREIARHCGVDHKSVAKWRKQLTGDFPTVQRGDTSATQHLATAPHEAEPDRSRTSLMLAEALVIQGLAPMAARRMLARLQALSPSERQAAERVLRELLG